MTSDRPTIPQHVRRQWFIAHMLVTWRSQHARMLRKASAKAGAIPGDEPPPEDVAAIDALKALRGVLEGWIASIDDVLAPEPDAADD